MGSQPITLWAEKEKEISLHGLVNDVIARLNPAEQKDNIISNDVGLNICILTDSVKVSGILKRILELIHTVSQKSHIHISAKNYSDLVLVHFRVDNIQNIGLVFNEINQMVPEAEQLAGFLGITSHENKLTTIAFTFINAKTPPRFYTDRLAQTIFQSSKRPRDKH